MKAIFSAEFHTDGDFCFRDFDSLFDKNSSMYKGAEIEYVNIHNGEDIYIRLNIHGEPNACRWAIRDLLEHMICSISTHKWYLVGELYEKISHFHDGLWEDMNQDKDAYMSGNYDGTYLTLRMRED